MAPNVLKAFFSKKLILVLDDQGHYLSMHVSKVGIYTADTVRVPHSKFSFPRIFHGAGTYIILK